MGDPQRRTIEKDVLEAIAADPVPVVTSDDVASVEKITSLGREAPA